MDNHQSPEHSALVSNLRIGIWLLGIPAWIFGAIERSAAIFSHPGISALDLAQVLTAAFFLGCWLLLKPTPRIFSLLKS
ncbi:MAG: hypothetical protein VKJ46_04230 [Leptolyngbyaceae bacterium]|nr:hypothetical protein [Leptolyngbyaceae bacterium]